MKREGARKTARSLRNDRNGRVAGTTYGESAMAFEMTQMGLAMELLEASKYLNERMVR